MGRRVLELACGTGIWTEQLIRVADHVTAVDSSPEAIAINRSRLPGAPVDYVEADVFTWEPPARYDTVFFSFWLSHVPPARFEAFWAKVAGALEPGGRAVFVDNAWSERNAWGEKAQQPTGYVQERDDAVGDTRFRVVKIFYKPEELAARLRSMGWACDVGATRRAFIYGWARPPSAPAAGGR